MVHDGEIVGREIPDHVDIVLKQAEVDSGGIVVIELSERSFLDHLPYAPDGAGEEERVIHHDPEVLAFRQFNQLLGLGGR